MSQDIISNRREADGHHRAGAAARVLAVLAVAVVLAPGFLGNPRRALAHQTHPRPRVLQLSNSPTDDEIVQSRVLPEPLVPLGPTTRSDDADLGRALVAYADSLREDDRDAVEPFTAFLTSHPETAWAAALQLNLGTIYRHTGHFSAAMDAWQAAWDESKDLQDANGRIVGDLAVARLSQFEAYLGRKETLQPLLATAKSRPIRGSAAELVSESARGLAQMVSAPEFAFKCGPSALARILMSQPPSATKAQSRVVLERARSTPNGLSLTAVQAISAEAGMNYQMAFRAPGAQVILPAVTHWRMGHYAALLGQDSSGRYHVGDATFGEDITMRPATFDTEASGYFLVPPGPLPAGWRPVDATEGNTVWGRGNTGDNHDNGATGCPETHAFPPGPGGGCSAWNVEAMVTGLSLHDDPIGYTPPVGPPIHFTLDYSQRDATQLSPDQYNYTNFGHLWTSGWTSWVQADAECAGFYGSFTDTVSFGELVENIIGTTSNPSCALLYRRGGGTEPYVFPSSVASPGTYPPFSALGQFSQAVLIEAQADGNISFLRTLPDGSTERFAYQFPGTNYYFLTSVADPQGNAVTLSYDNQSRLTTITDAMGLATRLCYSDSPPAPCVTPPTGSAPKTIYQVTQVVDPWNRSAFFGYDTSTGQLTSIKDVLGIVSSYTYAGSNNPTYPMTPDFVTSLTTPYETTQFAFSDNTVTGVDPASSDRSVTATDSLGNTSYVLFHQSRTSQGQYDCGSTNIPYAQDVDGDGIVCGEDPPVGPNLETDQGNGYLQFRNTFIWDPYQLSIYGTPAQNTAAYGVANIIHWLHTDGGYADASPNTSPTAASRIPESTKKPLEHRVWYFYLNQSSDGDGSIAYLSEGSTNQPIAVGRLQDDGSTQEWQYTYNGYGKVTQVIDPINRTLQLGYANNGLDLTTVTNTTDGRSDLLLSFPVYNSQREPLQITGANGTTSYLMYNQYGQLTSYVDPMKQSWEYHYGSSGWGYLTEMSGPSVAGQTPTYVFNYSGDPYGRLYQMTDPSGETLTFSYDDANRITQVLYPDQTTVQLGYTQNGQTLLDLTSITDRKGNTTTRTYNADRTLASVTSPTGGVMLLTYWPNKVLETITDSLGNQTLDLIDTEGRVVQQYDTTGAVTQYLYDGSGRLSVKDTPKNNEIQYTYNPANTVSAIWDTYSYIPTFYNYDPAYVRLTSWYQAVINPVTYSCNNGNGPTIYNCAGNPIYSYEQFVYNPVGPYLGANQLAYRETGITDATQTASPPALTLSSTAYVAYDALDRVLQA